ncbi:MAG: ACT domain-containing protein [Prosthecobacter sp.]|nr:ACT domain-containing protein [Prosthecobacter sp.]
MASCTPSSDSRSPGEPADVACLGPEGSFSHLLATRRFPGAKIHLLPSIHEVFDHLASHPGLLGLVPIENSSGGFIIDTVDRLMDGRCALHIIEELTLDVKLALLGHQGCPIQSIHSHAMPFYHADEWLKATHPNARRVVESSTAKAAEKAAQVPGAAAIGPKQNAAAYGLEVLHYPIAPELPNITQFYVLSDRPVAPGEGCQRTALIVELPDRPGSLCRFLTPLSAAGINLKRLESRPVRGHPNTYRFFVEVEGVPDSPEMAAALTTVRQDGAGVRIAGIYPAGRRFET